MYGYPVGEIIGRPTILLENPDQEKKFP